MNKVKLSDIDHSGSPATSPTVRGDGRWTRRAQIVFIVGSPRSGTTWLQAMLASHPCIATGPETQFFKAISGLGAAFATELPRQVGLRQYLSVEEFHATMAELFHRIASKVPEPEGPIPFFLEKTPEHCLNAPLILRCLPGARFIHLIRDGRHVVSSLIRAQRHWAKEPGQFYNVTYAARVWRQCVSAAREIPDLLDDQNDYIEIRYEDLRRAPNGNLSRLFEWLGLPADDPLVAEIVEMNDLDVVQQSNSFAAIASPGHADSRVRPSEPSSFFGRGATDERSFDLTRLQELQCYRIFGNTLNELGYCPSIPKVPVWAAAACSWKARRILGLPQI